MLFCLVASLWSVGCERIVEEVPSKERRPGAESFREKQVAAIARSLASIRGIALLHPIAVEVVSKERMKTRILAMGKVRMTPAQHQSEALLQKRFGLLPERADAEAMMAGLWGEKMTSVYDLDAKTLLVGDWVGSGEHNSIRLQVAHALLDQHFQLLSLMSTSRSSDERAARRAVIEGDAIALLLEEQMADSHQPPPWGNSAVVQAISDKLKASLQSPKTLPFYTREQLQFPFLTGLSFVAQLRSHHRWSEVSKVYSRPPLSTEQLLHPSRYSANEMPQSVLAGTLPGALPRFTQLHKDTLGEKGFELFLRAHGVDEAKAVVAAAGWGGDAIAVLTEPGHTGNRSKGTVGVFMSSWDNESDAIECMDALRVALSHWTFTGTLQPSGPAFTYKRGSEQFQLQRKGQVVVLAIHSAKTTGVMEAVWKRWKVRP